MEQGPGRSNTKWRSWPLLFHILVHIGVTYWYVPGDTSARLLYVSPYSFMNAQLNMPRMGQPLPLPSVSAKSMDAHSMVKQYWKQRASTNSGKKVRGGSWPSRRKTTGNQNKIVRGQILGEVCRTEEGRNMQVPSRAERVTRIVLIQSHSTQTHRDAVHAQHC